MTQSPRVRSVALLQTALLAALLGTSSGCLMCCNPMYDAYPAYGGAVQRTDRFHGRVGSVFEPAGVAMTDVTQAGQPAWEEVPTPAEGQPDETDPSWPDEPEPWEPEPDDLRPADPAPPLETGLK